MSALPLSIRRSSVLLSETPVFSGAEIPVLILPVLISKAGGPCSIVRIGERLLTEGGGKTLSQYAAVIRTSVVETFVSRHYSAETAGDASPCDSVFRFSCSASSVSLSDSVSASSVSNSAVDSALVSKRSLPPLAPSICFSSLSK